jgi:histone deacetylase complex regulatory component SIN3
MTVEQYLEEEMRRGGVITGGGEASAKKEEDADEDDIEKADAETYRLRKWDEFTDSVARGSGNTYNRG